MLLDPYLVLIDEMTVEIVSIGMSIALELIGTPIGITMIKDGQTIAVNTDLSGCRRGNVSENDPRSPEQRKG